MGGIAASGDLDGKREHLLDEERIALRAGEDPLSLALIDLHPERFDEALRIVPGERLERNDE